MRHLRLDAAVDALAQGEDTVLLLALDGWTDAGSGGTLAADALRDQADVAPLGAFDPDALYDYRDRRPLLSIDQGVLGEPEWPSLTVEALSVEGMPPLVLVQGGEPDLSWQTIASDLVELARRVGATRYIGLGAVPGPIPHTRPVRVICTANDDAALEQIGRPHERMIVPASFQVVVEAALRDAGLSTLGLWARIPHYVAGDYPEAARALLSTLAAHLDAPLATSDFDEAVDANRERLDGAASSSPEIIDHIHQLEEAYDADVADDAGITGPLPTGDQIAADFERFLRQQE